MKSNQTNEILQTLMKCITACENCATECLSEDNVNHMERCIRLDRDCADICALTARFIGRDSEAVNKVLQLCIEACRECEKECRKHDHDHCQKCAEACHECHQACEQYVSAHA